MALEFLRVGKTLIFSLFLLYFVLSAAQPDTIKKFSPCCYDNNLVLNADGTKCICKEQDYYFLTRSGDKC